MALSYRGKFWLVVILVAIAFYSTIYLIGTYLF